MGEGVGVLSFSVGGHGLNMRGQLMKPPGNSQDPDLVSAFNAVFLQTSGVEAEKDDVIDTSLQVPWCLLC